MNNLKSFPPLLDDIDPIGTELYEWCSRLFPQNRSITGDGVRNSLAFISTIIPELSIFETPTGASAYDWNVPSEWNITDAFIIAPDGQKFADFKINNLHIVGYSEPIDLYLSLEELDKHLHSRPDMPDVVPYITSYYSPNWGFCLPHNQRTQLKEGRYHAVIRSTLTNGSMTHGELFVKGETEKEILLSTYTCHPSMASNETSGLAVTTAIARWLQQQKTLKYSYRIFFAPETIGAVFLIKKYLHHFREHLEAGFIITCVGDDHEYSFMPSREGNTYADRLAKFTLTQYQPSFKTYSFLERGSDECQYCSPRVNLPVASIMRTKYHEYPEYHTSADNLDYVSPEGLQGGYEIYIKLIRILESNYTLKAKNFCEPQFSKNPNLRKPLINGVRLDDQSKLLSDVLAYADGVRDILDLVDLKIAKDTESIKSAVDILLELGYLEPAPRPTHRMY